MREHILDVASRILQMKGPQALSSRTIADELGMAHMALYTYFDNQSAILQALAEREMVKVRAPQERFEKRAEHEDIVVVMRAALEFYPQFERENPNLFRLSWVVPQYLPEEIAHANARSRESLAHLTRLVQRGIERGVFKPRLPQLAAAAAWGMVLFPLIMFHSGRIASPGQRDILVAEMLEAAMDYLCV
jgi:AcrR family transcriptional regulator